MYQGRRGRKFPRRLAKRGKRLKQRRAVLGLALGRAVVVRRRVRSVKEAKCR